MRYQINKQKFLSDAELEHLTALLQKDLSRDSILIETGLETGARANELLNIKTTDLDTSHRTVFIRGLKNSNDREIPVTKLLFNKLKLLADNSKDGTVFGISYPTLVNIWNQYKPADKSFKSLRHTFAIQLYKRTKDLRLVQVALGHRNIMNTVVYADYVYQTEELRKLLKRK